MQVKTIKLVMRSRLRRRPLLHHGGRDCELSTPSTVIGIGRKETELEGKIRALPYHASSKYG